MTLLVLRSLLPLCLLLVVGCSGQLFGAQDFDLLIRGGRLVDGTGNPWFRGDVGVRGGRIVAVGDLSGREAGRVIEAGGLIVSPGFIDMHNHSDPALGDRELRFAQPFLTQGVTTIVLGVDGRGPAHIEAVVDPWLKAGIGVNVAFYVGHNAARLAVMGIDNRAPSRQELERMQEFVAQGMESGAFGLSTGLEYIPGIYSRTEEVVELARVAARYGGIYDTHYRDEFYGFLDSIREGIEIARQANLPVHFGHFKVIGKHNWGHMEEALEIIEEARRQGLDITADLYPWDNGATGTLVGLVQVPDGLGVASQLYRELFTARLPGSPSPGRGEALERYVAALRSLLADRERRAAVRRATEQGLKGPEHRNWISMWGYDWIRIVRSRLHPQYVGQVLSEIAAWKATSGFELLADLIVSEGEDLKVSIGPLSEADLRRAMVRPWVMFSSDGALVPFGEGYPHPRSYGSFPRVYRRYVREERLLELEEAVRKMTSLPAQRLGLRDRGLLREGMWADIVIFDPVEIAERATFENPHQYSVGVRWVVVNGEIVWDRDGLSGRAPGKFLKGPGAGARSGSGGGQ